LHQDRAAGVLKHADKNEVAAAAEVLEHFDAPFKFNELTPVNQEAWIKRVHDVTRDATSHNELIDNLENAYHSFNQTLHNEVTPHEDVSAKTEAGPDGEKERTGGPSKDETVSGSPRSGAKDNSGRPAETSGSEPADAGQPKSEPARPVAVSVKKSRKVEVPKKEMSLEDKIAHIAEEHPAFMSDTTVPLKTLEDGKWVTTQEPAHEAVSNLKKDVSDLTAFAQCVTS
jgi:hypothetical protein